VDNSQTDRFSRMISIKGLPLLRVRFDISGHYVTRCSEQSQWLSGDHALMCHNRDAQQPSTQVYPSEKFDPCILCTYDIDCIDIADLRTDVVRAYYAVSISDLQCDWRADDQLGLEPRSWRVARRLMSDGCAGVLVPSFAPGASSANLVLWKWGSHSPHKVIVFDPRHRLPRNQSSWDF
jgi:RES domain-containing protein